MRNILSILMLVLASLVPGGCATDQLKTVAPRSAGERLPGADGVAGAYKIMVGDRVKVSLFDMDAQSGEYTVDQVGAVIVPPLDPLVIAGLTPREAADLIARSFSTEGMLRGPRVSVDVVSYRPVYVLGEVVRPGEFVYRPDMSLLAAVAAAGGYTYRADRKQVFIRRARDRYETVYDLRSDIALLPGDVIRVPEIHF